MIGMLITINEMLMKHILHLLAVLLLVGSISSGIKAENIRYEWGVYQLSGDTAVFLKEIWWVESGGHGWYPPGPPYGFYVCDTVINENTGKSHVVTALAGRYKAGERPTYSNINCGEDWIKIFRIPNTVKYIGDGACGCERGSSFPPITLDLNPDNNVLMVGDKSFYANQFNNWLYLPKVLSIGRSAFQNCKEMPGVTLGNALHTVKERAFAGCMFDQIELGDAIETIGDRAFRGCENLRQVTIKGSPVIVGDSAFVGCGKLETISFGNAPDTLGVSAFEGCGSLRYLEIGDPGKWSRTVFGNENSNPITNTNRFTVNGSVVQHLDICTEEKVVSEWAFTGAGDLLSVRVRGGGVIEADAFNACTAIRRLCLEVDRIDRWAFSGDYAIREIYSLTATPPDAETESFAWYGGVTLYVPVGSGDAYRSHPVWCRFSKIEETDFAGIDALFKADYDVSGIDDIRTDVTGDADEEAPVRIYTLDGRHAGENVETLRPGIYILRQGRKARKITVR